MPVFVRVSQDFCRLPQIHIIHDLHHLVGIELRDSSKHCSFNELITGLNVINSHVTAHLQL